MLLTSPGDHTASPLDSLSEQTQQTNGMPRPDSLECSQRLLTASPSKMAPKAIVGDRDKASVPISPADAAPSGDRAPQPPALTQPLHRQRVLRPYLFDEMDGLYALQRAARLRTLRQPQTDRQSKIVLNTLPDLTGYRALGSYAAPLSPLRVRDVTALSALFQRDDMPTIEADVNHRLLSLLPEPCWEDDVFAFLQEFL